MWFNEIRPSVWIWPVDQILPLSTARSNTVEVQAVFYKEDLRIIWAEKCRIKPGSGECTIRHAKNRYLRGI